MDNFSKKLFGNYIKKKREEKGFTREEFANKLNVSYQALAKWEHGTRLPDFQMIGIIADKLGISVQDIYDNSKRDSKSVEKIATIIISSILVLVVIGGCILAFMHNGREKNSEDNQNASSPCSSKTDDEILIEESMKQRQEEEEITFEKLTDEQAIVYNEIMEKYKKYLEQKKKQSQSPFQYQIHYGISVFAYYKAIGKGTELSDVVVRTKKTQVIEKYDSIKLTPVFESPSLSDCYFIRASYDEIIDMYFNSDIIEVLHIAKECAHVPDIINDYLIFNVYNDCPEMVASFWDQWSDVVVFMGEDGCYKVYWQCVPE